MPAELNVLNLETDPFEVTKSQICATVSQLDEAVGRPPFPNPSRTECRSLAQSLVYMLRDTHKKGFIAALAGCPEVNMTFPVLCASLTCGSEGRKPCPVLMELFLEALVYMHSISMYPLKTTLKDAKEILPMSPMTFRLFVVTSLIDVDTMCSFLGLKPALDLEKKSLISSKRRCQAATAAKKGGDQKTGDAASEEAVIVSMDMLNAALDMDLPPDCRKVLLSLFDSPGKFQQTVRSDSKLAARVINVYGDYLLPNLPPLSFLRCLDVSLLDTFIHVLQMHGESMTLFTEPVFTQIPLAEWSCERILSLIRYCEERKVRREEAFASLVVYVFLCKLLVLFKKPSLIWLPINEEARFWIAILNVSLLIPRGTGTATTVEEEHLPRLLGIVAECIMRRHAIDAVTAIARTIPHETVIDVLQILTHLLYAKGNLMSAAASSLQNKRREQCGGSKKKKKGGRQNVNNNNNKPLVLPTQADLINQYCKGMANSFSFLFWLTPQTVVLPDSCNPWRIVESLAAVLLCVDKDEVERGVHISTWECFLNFLLTVVSMREEKDDMEMMGQKTTAAMLAAVRITHRVECCGVIAQRVPEAYAPTRWPLGGYKLLFDAWLGGKTHTEGFYAPVAPLSSRESMGIVIDLLDSDRLYELAYLLSGAEQTTAALFSALEKVVEVDVGVGVTGLMRLRDELLKCVENRLKMSAEQKQKEAELKRMQLLADVQRAEELMEKATIFKEEAERRQKAKNEELTRIHQMREEQQRKKKEQWAQERREQQEKRQKTLATLREMATKTRAERVEKQRERLLRYRERVSSAFYISSFLESLRLPPSRIMHLMSTLRPYIDCMTLNDLLECVVTGNREVPSDMYATDEEGNDADVEESLKEKEERACFSEEGLSFWDSVMQIIAQQSDKWVANSHEDKNEELESNMPFSFSCASAVIASSSTSTVGGSGGDFLSFHRRVSGVLNLFDYSMGTNEELPDPLPSLSVRAASRVLARNTLVGSGFCNGREALLACQQRGLCVLNDDVCTLTPLGFRYHFPFHDPEQMLDVQLEWRRCKARRLLEKRRKGGDNSEEEEDNDEYVWLSDTNSSMMEGDVVYFADELM